MKKQYITPMLTVVTFKVERGFALSNGNGFGPQNSFLGLIGLDSDWAEGYNTQGQQNWNESNYFDTGWN